MYRLVLVDDEDWILSGLETAVEWESLGFCVTGTYNNSSDALKAMLENPPDVLLTDIKMPILDGLSLVKELRQAGENQIEVVFLSGYDDFKLAQSSIRLGAVDYILKPSDMDQITEVFKKIKVKLDRERQLEKERVDEKEMAQMGIRILKQTVFDSISFGNSVQYQRLMRLHAGFMERKLGQRFSITSVALKNTVEENIPQEAERDAIQCIKNRAAKLKQDMPENIDLIEKQFSCAVVFLNLTAEKEQYIVDTLRREVRNETNQEIVCGWSRPFIDFWEIWEAYRISQERLYQLDMSEEAKRLYLELSGDTGLAAALQDWDQQIIIWSLRNWVARINSIEPEYQMRLLRQMVYQVSISCMEQGLPSQSVQQLYHTMEEAGCETMKEEIITFAKAEFIKTPSDGGRNANLCREVAKYISKNYADVIKINELADRFYISPNYLGTLFKRSMGMGIREYQTTVRLEQADALIASGKFKLYQVAEMVGYPNYEYFRKIYAKYRGKNPSKL